MDKKLFTVFLIDTSVNSIWVQLCLFKRILGTALSIMLPSNALNTNDTIKLHSNSAQLNLIKSKSEQEGKRGNKGQMKKQWYYLIAQAKSKKLKYINVVLYCFNLKM